MLIDVHAHQFTAGMLNRDEFWGPSMKVQGLTVGHWWLGAGKAAPKAASDADAEAGMLKNMSLTNRLKQMDERGVDRLVFSTPSHAFMYWAGEFGNEYARICNDELAGFCKQAPDKFDFWCHANLAEPASAAKEIDRAVRQLGAKGLCMGGANFNGLEVYDERMFPIWEKVVELDVPVMVHGYNQSIWWGGKHIDDRFETTSILGDCYDETLYIWYLVNGGVLDVFPTLKSYVCHAGGMAVMQLGRMADLNGTMAPDARNRRPFMDYMDNFYLDLDVHAPSLRKAIVDVVGVDRLLYGTNFGGAYSHGDLTEGVGLSEVDRDKIRAGNAIELLKLNPALQPA